MKTWRKSTLALTRVNLHAEAVKNGWHARCLGTQLCYAQGSCHLLCMLNVETIICLERTSDVELWLKKIGVPT